MKTSRYFFIRVVSTLLLVTISVLSIGETADCWVNVLSDALSCGTTTLLLKTRKRLLST